MAAARHPLPRESPIMVMMSDAKQTTKRMDVSMKRCVLAYRTFRVMRVGKTLNFIEGFAPLGNRQLALEVVTRYCRYVGTFLTSKRAQLPKPTTKQPRSRWGKITLLIVTKFQHLLLSSL